MAKLLDVYPAPLALEQNFVGVVQMVDCYLMKKRDVVASMTPQINLFYYEQPVRQ